MVSKRNSDYNKAICKDKSTPTKYTPLYILLQALCSTGRLGIVINSRLLDQKAVSSFLAKKEATCFLPKVPRRE